MAQLGQELDLPVRAERRDQDRCGHNRPGNHAIGAVAGGIELAHRKAGRGLEQHRKEQHLHRQRAQPAEYLPVAGEHGAFVVIGGQFRAERRVGHFVEGNRDAHEQCGADKPGQRQPRTAVRGHPQQGVSQPDRNGGGIHVGVPPPPPGPRLIGKMADHGIDHAVDNQRDHDHQSDSIGGQADHLIVEQEQDRGETVVLDAIGDRAETIGKSRGLGQPAALGNGTVSELIG